MYDHIRFHTEEDYPENLLPENAVIHVGMYWQWAARTGLADPVWQAAPETAANFTAIIEDRLSGARFLLEHMGGTFTPDDFNPLGQSFASYYYDGEEEGYGAFMENYIRTLDTPSLGGFYYAEDSPETHAKLAPVFQTAFEKWKSSLVM